MLLMAQKSEIMALVLTEKERLGSLKAVSTKCGVSEATVSQVVNHNWDQIADKMWLKIAAALEWKPEGWQMVETTNYRMLTQVFQDAKDQSLWMAVSHPAGSGKTAAGRSFAALYGRDGVFYVQAREWTRRSLMLELCRTLGIAVHGGSITAEVMFDLVVGYFQQRAWQKPLLIIDEADKLKAEALRMLIPLFNELEDKLALVIMGTENLERDISIGVQWQKKGFDEIHSRFGRAFIHLLGCTYKDVQAICEANGITDPETQRTIWKECLPVRENVQGRFVEMVNDTRRIRRAILREILKINTNNGN